MTRIGSLFSGYGGLDLAAREVLGGTVVWHCDNDTGASAVLAHHWPDVPNLSDITAVDWSTVEPIDVLTGGFPCQDVSVAGRRVGLRPDTRSGLWSHMRFAIAELRPPLVIIENVRGLLSAHADSELERCPWCMGDGEDVILRALGAVLGDLASLGYDANWCGLPASAVGAPHGRSRIFIAAFDSARSGPQGSPRGRIQPVKPVSRRDVAADPGRDARAEDDSDVTATTGGRGPAADSNSDALRQQPEPVEERGGTTVAEQFGPDDWGQFDHVIRRWEAILGRPAPCPTVVGARGGRVLNPVFVEFLMGLASGHVTSVPGLGRIDQLKLLGNGVVPQQAVAALDYLLAPEHWGAAA